MLEKKRWTWSRPTHPFNPSSKAAVKIENGYIFYSELWEPYFPFDFPNLPNRLAKVDNVASATEFVNKYGVLGYHAFYPDMEKEYGTSYIYKKGDPIEWFLIQARTVRFALNLIGAIQEKDDGFIGSFIKDTTVTVPLKMFIERTPDKTKTLAHIFAIGPETGYIRYQGEDAIMKSEQRLLALQIVEHLVNSNTEGVQRRLDFAGQWSPDKPYRLVQTFSARSLIESIWHFVGEAALLSQDKKSKGVRTCQECGLPFISTDGRQRFCPGDEFSKGSLCGARYRMRKHRKTGKGKV